MANPLRKRDKYNLSHRKLLTADMGKLVPIGCMEVLPGDTFRHSTSMLLRTTPLVVPTMHPVDVRIHHWYVPSRIIWDDFEDFITGGADGNDATVHPYRTFSSVGEGSLFDYMGVPPTSNSNDLSVLPLRAYYKIWNENYRDQDLQDEVSFLTTSGEDTTTDNLDPLSVCWQRDIFTSARPWTQKGDDIVVPIGSSAPVITDGTTPKLKVGANAEDDLYHEAGATTRLRLQGDENTGDVVFGSNTGLLADLSSATGLSVNDMRLSFALQSIAEDNARYGSRFCEFLQHTFGVKSRDSRLDRPEYLGGGRQTIQFSEVLATAEGTSTDVGDLKGHGIAALKSNAYRRFFEEHGYVISLMSVRPVSMYMQGLPELFTRTTRSEYFTPRLQFIGDEVIQNREVYIDHGSPTDTFGYRPRYSSYKTVPSTVASEMRSTEKNWHMAREFSSDPALNDTFVECTPTERIYASTTAQPLKIMCNHSIAARRPVVRNAKPKIM